MAMKRDLIIKLTADEVGMLRAMLNDALAKTPTWSAEHAILSKRIAGVYKLALREMNAEINRVLEARRKTNTRYVDSIPRKLAKGRVLVHNHVVPQPILGGNGFRAWTQRKAANVEVCSCDWAGVDLGGLVHYRVNLKTKAARAGGR
jgi:hypothetical protein